MLQATKRYSTSLVPLECFDRTFPTKALLTIGAMGAYTEKDGTCCVSRSTLAEMLKLRNLSCAEIANQIKVLVERGYVFIVECPDPENDDALCLYRLDIECDPNQPVYGRD
ncbi:MAG TPA: hypothetical protein PKW33_00785 [Anaerolineaceae bacterium]|nr:hypothetical protein [Anaerolineaceae bacterium]HPN50093.1 hypothetical protein [Anaerolineaceae bacterium]